MDTPKYFNFLQRIFTKETSSFEHGLFAQGVLEYNPAEVENLLRNQVASFVYTIAWHENHPNPTIRHDAMEAGFDHFIKANLMADWYRVFAGKIPATWEAWYKVMEDIQNAKKLGIQLSDDLVTAGAVHPHWLVVREAGLGQRLNSRQLSWAFVLGMSVGTLDEIISAQKSMGLINIDIDQAKKEGEILRGKLWGIYQEFYLNYRSGRNSDRSAFTQFSELRT